MRRLLSLIALLATLLGQAPLAACPASLATGRILPDDHVTNTPSHQHDHTVGVTHAAAAPNADTSVTTPGPEHSRHGDSCTMATTCQWAAVPGQMAEWRLPRGLTPTTATPPPDWPVTAEQYATTPPPKKLS